MPNIVVTLLGFLGMRREVPPTLLDVQPAPALPMRELVNMDPSEGPALTPRPCFQDLDTITDGVNDSPKFPRGKV